MVIIFDLTLYDTIVQGIDIITIFMNMVHLLKLHAWKVGDRVFEPHYGLQASKKLDSSLKGSVILLISPSSEGSLGPV